MPIELAGIRLERIHKIKTLEQADFVSHRIPGLDGNVVQNMGRESVRLQIEGIFYGETAGKDLETLRTVYKDKEPVDFLAEIVGQAYFGQVILERFEVSQHAGEPNQISYILTIAEYVEPPEPAGVSALDAVNKSIEMEAQAFMDIAGLPDLLGSIPEVTNPLQPLSSALDPVKKATADLPAVTEGLKGIFGI